MYRIKEEQEQGLTIYKMQEGYVRKFKPNGFGITKEVVWISRVRTTESNLAIDAYKAAQSMSAEDFKSYVRKKQNERFGCKQVAVKTKLDQAAFDHQQLEAKMSEMIIDLQLEAKKYKELKEIVAETIRMINQGAILQPNSLLVLALNEGIK